MHLDTNVMTQIAHDRRQRLLDDAAASRLAGMVPARVRFARALRRTADRLDAAAARPARVPDPLADCG
jgi:hypothetical protein